MAGFGNPLLDLWRDALDHQQRHLPPAEVEALRASRTGRASPAFQCAACVATRQPGVPLSDAADAHRVALSRYGCGILDGTAVELVRTWSGPRGIVEVGAGTGYSARLLAEAGLDVVATDLRLPGEAPDESAWQATAQPPYVPVERLDAEDAVRRYPDRTLLMVWPAYGDSYAARALDAYTGAVVVYLGEYRGATADVAFHDALDRNWECVVRQPVPSWRGVRDEIMVYQRV